MDKKTLMAALRKMPSANHIYFAPGDHGTDMEGDIEACLVEYVEQYDNTGSCNKFIRLKAGC